MLNIADGSEMAAYVSKPGNSATNLPAIILGQEAFGVNHHIRSVAARFAEEGYLVIAPELFHRTAPKGFEGDYTDFNTVAPHTKALTIEGIDADLQACFQWLCSQQNVDEHKIYSVGYCMGGRVAFLANAILPLKAAVSYYGGNLPALAGKAKDLHGKHLFYWGGKDRHITDEHIQIIIKAMDEAGKDYLNVKISSADHGFNCDERASYDEAASKEAWALTLAFLKNSWYYSSIF